MLVLTAAAWAQSNEDIEVVNIENAAVRDYMADATYFQNNDFTKSVITKYNNPDRYGKRLYWPNGKTARWTHSAPVSEIAEVKITVSENPDYSNAAIHFPDSKSETSFMIRNCLPNRTYYYKVEEKLNNGEVYEVDEGMFRTEGRLRMIQVRNCSNVRDLGGWMTQYGYPIKYGMLFRSAHLGRITANGRQDFVKNLNVHAELDLRSESKLTKSPLGPDEDLLVLAHSSYMPGMTKKNNLYVKDLAWIVKRLKEGKAVDWHCAIGCDRCGTVSFLIEGLLGMYEVDLCRDYELSTLSLGTNNKRVRGPLKTMIKHIRSFAPNGSLADGFYNYWKSIGANEDDMIYLINHVVDFPE